MKLNDPCGLFISAVSDEFEPHRQHLLTELNDSNWTSKGQEKFKAPGHPIVELISDDIADCAGVVHLVGTRPGTPLSNANVEAILVKLPDLLTKLQIDRANLSKLSYTQFEAYLAIYHGRQLWIAKPTSTVVTDASASGLLSQKDHLEMLQRRGYFPATHLRFDDPESLELRIRRSVTTEIQLRRCQNAVERLNDSFQRTTRHGLIGNVVLERSETGTRVSSSNSPCLARFFGLLPPESRAPSMA